MSKKKSSIDTKIEFTFPILKLKYFIIKAKEQGDAYYINQFGEVVIPQEGKPAVIVTRDELCGKTTPGEN